MSGIMKMSTAYKSLAQKAKKSLKSEKKPVVKPTTSSTSAY